MARASRKTGGSDDWAGKFIIGIGVAALIKVAVDEIALIAEHGIDNWRRRRFGW